MNLRPFIFTAVITACLSAVSCADRLMSDDHITYTAVSPMPVATASAACAVVDDVAYVFGGRAPKGVCNSLYSYTPASDRWEKLDDVPVSARSGAVAVAHGNDIYMGLGYSGRGVYNNSYYLRDWWRFTPATGEWKRLADYPSNTTASPSAFVHEGSIYIVFGFFDNFNLDVFRYDMAADTWEKVSMDGVIAKAESVAAEVDGRYFAGNNGRWFEFIPSIPRWELRSISKGVPELISSSIFAYDHALYIVGGREWNSIGPDGRILRYDPAEDCWAIAGHLPSEGGKENMISFVIDGVPYIGLGEEKEKLNAAMYKLTMD